MVKEGLNNNAEIAGIFYEMAEIFQLKNVKWKPQAYIVASQSIESLGEDVFEIYKRGGKKELMEIPGIGERLAEKIIQYLKNGKIEEHEKLKKSIPAGLYDIMKIPGVGAKKAQMFYKKLKIKDIDELYRAAEEHKLLKLRGFKERAEEKIMEGINILKGQKGRIPFRQASVIANKILMGLKKLPEVKEAVAAGSLRRKKSTIGDIDIVIRTNSPERVLQKFVKMNFVKQVLGIGKEKASIISNISKNNIQVDARVFTDEEFGAGLLYFTGDKGHNIWLRKIAIKKGWKLNEYGLFDEKKKRIAGVNEKEIYEALSVKMPAPEKRIGEIK